MDSPIVTLPCSSHRECLSHNPIASTVIFPRTNSASIQTLGSIVLPSTTPQQAPILQLPFELLHGITDRLHQVDVLSLSLTCRWMRNTFRNRFLIKKRSKLDGKCLDLWDINTFLKILARDLRERYWHCEACRVLHMRTVQPPHPNTGGIMNKLLRRTSGTKEPEAGEVGVFDIRVECEQLYALTYPTLKGVMEHHARAKRKGVSTCLENLRCFGVRQFPCSDNEDRTRVLRYSFQPKIVLERLLLRAVYTWELHMSGVLCTRDKFLEEDKRLQSLNEAFKDIGMWVCKHMTMASVLEAAQRRRYTREFLRCQNCPTQFWVGHAEDTMRIEISLWHNLGSGQEPGDIRWRHLVSAPPNIVEYGWAKASRNGHGHADEDIWAAYKWIGYETRQEFEKDHGKFDSKVWWSRCDWGIGDPVRNKNIHSFQRAVAESL